ATRSEDRNVTVGGEWTFARPDVLPQSQLMVSRIGGAFGTHLAVNQVLLRDEGEFGVRWRTGPLMKCGLWSLRIDSSAKSTTESVPLVVNVDSRESDLERIAWEQLPVELRGGGDGRPSDGAPSIPAPDIVDRSAKSTGAGGANGARGTSGTTGTNAAAGGVPNGATGATASAAQSTFARLLLVIVVVLAVFENQLLSRHRGSSGARQ
ncbi:MAG TPA: hypothetical protein PLV92_30415, partial [Pirellulaceae bacterium]|nr:hypothetical protein [Pirellulaceae bacterium]